MKLFTRFNRIHLTVMAVVFLLSGIMYYFLLQRVLVHELDEALSEYKDRVDDYVHEHHKLPEFSNFDEIVVRYKTTDHPHKKKLSTVTLYDEEEQKNSIFRQLVFTEQIQGQWYQLSIARPVEGTKLVTKTVAFMTLSLLLVVVLLSVILNQIILKKLWKPFYDTIRELQEFKLSKKNLPVFPKTDIEEFCFMNEGLSQVINNANDDYKILKEFTENAAHELQTPLAIIRSKLDLVIQEEGLSENQTNALQSAYKGIHRLTRLNQSLLLLAKIENHQFAGIEAITLKEKLEEKLDQFHEFWSASNIEVSAVLHRTVISANPELIDILLNNLLANAGRHNRDGGAISIILDNGVLSISNTGSEKELDKNKLFNRFYKESSASQYNGLGLSIVKQICERSGINIRYQHEGEYHSFILSWQV